MGRELKAINVEVGARIREARSKLQLTRDELAAKVGYSANFIQEVERGRSGLSSESIKAFSSALNVSADALLFGSESSQYDFVLRRLSTVSPEKIGHILAILEEAIECAK